MEDARYVHLRPSEPPPSLDSTYPYRAVLVVEQAVSDEWRSLVCDMLVGTGCRYMLAWGRDCEIWHDSVDSANLARFDFQEFPDDELVMTTWHSDETLAEVFWFAEHGALHPDVDIDKTVIVHISAEPRATELTEAFNNAQASVS
jgi:hypothetical protein